MNLCKKYRAFDWVQYRPVGTDLPLIVEFIAKCKKYRHIYSPQLDTHITRARSVYIKQTLLYLSTKSISFVQHNYLNQYGFELAYREVVSSTSHAQVTIEQASSEEDRFETCSLLNVVNKLTFIYFIVTQLSQDFRDFNSPIKISWNRHQWNQFISVI